MDAEKKGKCRIFNGEYAILYNQKNATYWGVLQTPIPLEFSFKAVKDKNIVKFEPSKTAGFMIKAIADAIL